MKWIIDLFTKLFQSAVKLPVEPDKAPLETTPPKAPVEIPKASTVPQTPDVAKPAPMLGGGRSGGGGASGTIPEPVRPAVYDEAVTYHEAIRLILRFEGGYVNDPADPGEETNKGVTKKVYDEYRESKGLPVRSVRDISDEEVSDIYRTMYWLEGKCDKLPAYLSIVHFDTSVNAGIRQAAKLLQRTVGAKDDGVIGSGTLGKVTEKVTISGDLATALIYLGKRRDFYKNLVAQKPALQKFLKGWMNRVDTLEKYLNDRKA